MAVRPVMPMRATPRHAPPAPRRPAAAALAAFALVAFALLALAAALPAVTLPASVAAPLSALARSGHAAGLAVEARLVAGSLAERGDDALGRGPYRVLYPPGHEAEARLVLAALERFAPPVFQDLGARLPARLTAVVAKDGKALDGELGITGLAPVGAYWRGVIWVLAPSAWLGGSPGDDWSPDGPLGTAFLEKGPIPHELAHAALDLRLGHEPETWFDEGVAQLEDERQTGFVWREPTNDFDQPLYSYEELRDEFSRLPNEALAYREAYALVRALAEARGGRGLDEVLRRMQLGLDADRAARAVLGPDYPAWRAGSAWSAGTP